MNSIQKPFAVFSKIKWYKTDTVIAIIEKIPLKQQNLVIKITLDRAGNMGLIAKKCFPNTTRVTDRFHIQKLATEALQEIRIKYRWQTIDQENEAIEKVKKNKRRFESEVLTNRDTLKQLLARSRYFLYKNKSKWSENQLQRAHLLFELYPDIQKTYSLTQGLPNIFEKTTDNLLPLFTSNYWALRSVAH